jgi:hypothetical protein
MDYVIDLDPTHRVLRLTVTSAFTDETWMDAYRIAKRLASQGGPYAGITDLSQVVDFRVSSDTMRTLAKSGPVLPGGRPQIIVASQPALYGLARMGELIRDSMGGQQIEVVHTIDEAYDLLKVTPQDFSQRLFPEAVAA